MLIKPIIFEIRQSIKKTCVYESVVGVLFTEISFQKLFIQFELVNLINMSPNICYCLFANI